MRRLLILLWLLLIPAMNAGAYERVIHYHDNSVLGPPLVTGSDLSLTIQSEGRAPLSFSVPVPALYGAFPQKQYYESDAASLGVNWNELESLMAGPEFKETIWGQPGLGSTQSFPYIVSDAPRVYAKVDLTRINVGYLRTSNLNGTFIWFDGKIYLVPEPSTMLLALAGIGLFGICRRSIDRTRYPRNASGRVRRLSRSPA